MMMRERIMNGKLFTDECEGLPEERTAAKKRMKSFNESSPENPAAAGNPCKVIRQIDERDSRYYFKDRMIDKADLAEEAKLRKNK